LLWILFGLAVFSISLNKLAGYVLPLLPAIAVLLAVSLEEVKSAHWWLAACATLLIVFPVSAPAASVAVATGFSSAALPPFHWTWLSPAAVVAAAWILERRGRRIAALGTVAAGAAFGIAFLKSSAGPELNRLASARNLWAEIQPYSGSVCLDNLERSWRFGLNYYSVTPLPECSAEARPVHVIQDPDQPPRVVKSHSRLTPTHMTVYSRLSTTFSRKIP
jgi:4-amino-4-deoxy-L-arabinose transferase